MKRIKKPRPDLLHQAIVEMEECMDALDWCLEHPSTGRFFFNWFIENGEIRGEFHFKHEDDRTLFFLRWCK